MKTFANLCMACNKQHVWALVHPMYSSVCGDCVKTDPRVDWDESEEQYTLFGYCSCGERGPVNFGRHDTNYQYYCNGSPRCCP